MYGMQVQSFLGKLSIMPVPLLPQFTSSRDQNWDLLVTWLGDLVDYLNKRDSLDMGWSVIGTATDRVLNSGDTLSATQDVLGTLINLLLTQGILRS